MARKRGERQQKQDWRIAIGDDELVARRALRDELAAYSYIEIVAEAEDGVSAAGLIEELTPDLISLDLQTPAQLPRTK